MEILLNTEYMDNEKKLIKLAAAIVFIVVAAAGSMAVFYAICMVWPCVLVYLFFDYAYKHKWFSKKSKETVYLVIFLTGLCIVGYTLYAQHEEEKAHAPHKTTATTSANSANNK
jgi:fatty acid desaturase